MDAKQVLKKFQDLFGSRESFLGHQLIELSMLGQPCDVTFFNRKPILEVAIDPQLHLAVAYGAGPAKLLEKLKNVKLSNGEVVSIEDVWTLNPMHKGGLTSEELAAVDLAKAEDASGPNGETLRKMISDTYHCENRDEEDHYIRRFIAS